jgi:hypothetical protein
MNWRRAGGEAYMTGIVALSSISRYRSQIEEMPF